jgi:hypothetical protein
MTENKAPLFTCEVCGREGDYNDFLDLNDDDWNDPFTIYTVCPECYEQMRQNEIAGSMLLLFYIIGFIFAGFAMKIQIILLIIVYVLNLLRRLFYFSFLKTKIHKDNLKNPKEFLLSKINEQVLLCLLTPIDLITSPMRFYINRSRK